MLELRVLEMWIKNAVTIKVLNNKWENYSMLRNTPADDEMACPPKNELK